MLYGLDLFSGVGGITFALSPWVRPVAYCENDTYAQGVLLSRMEDGSLPVAPIWDDVRTLGGVYLPGVDIIYGGFPCQDISVAGSGKGLAGERSGLFFEIVRLSKEIKPRFIFLENVPAIRTRGLNVVGEQLASLGYDLRWGIVSAEEMGALHKRERWFCLAHFNSESIREQSRRGERASRREKTEHERGFNTEVNLQGCGDNKGKTPREDDKKRCEECTKSFGNGGNTYEREGLSEVQTSDNGSERVQRERAREVQRLEGFSWCQDVRGTSDLQRRSDIPQPLIRGKGNGVQNRVDRIKCLGNAVVPIQAREAFIRLMGLK